MTEVAVKGGGVELLIASIIVRRMLTIIPHWIDATLEESSTR